MSIEMEARKRLFYRKKENCLTYLKRENFFPRHILNSCNHVCMSTPVHGLFVMITFIITLGALLEK